MVMLEFGILTQVGAAPRSAKRFSLRRVKYKRTIKEGRPMV